MKRDFDLPEEDREWLEARGQPFECVNENGVLRVVVHNLAVPEGYEVGQVSANVRLDAGYPDTQIDMVYFSPPLTRADGQQIGGLSGDLFDGKEWQRWSRHRTPANPWRPGVDNLATHFGLVHDWLEREFRK